MMLADTEVLQHIRTLLAQNRRGMTTREIGERLCIHRNSVAKYMDLLRAQGEVETAHFGNTRVFFPARRLPVSALLNLSSDLVCMVDESEHLLSANPKFHDFFGLDGGDVSGKSISEIRAGAGGTTSLSDLFGGLITGDEVVRDLTLNREAQGSPAYPCYLRARGIPTVFDDGTPGTTILIEDLTAERNYLKNLEFLVRTSADLADMGDQEDIYQYIAEQVYALQPGSIVSIGSIDTENKVLTVRGVAGSPEDLELLTRIFGPGQVGMQFPFEQEPLAMINLMKKTLLETPNLSSMFFYHIPGGVLSRFAEEFSFGTGFAIGCACRGGLYGDVAIFLKKAHALRNSDVIEAFIAQAAVALQRRHLREKLRERRERQE
ncbi:MAG: PAS domain S-box protein [Methanoregulaceae archaeon]|jgi:PAS domain S-box-containing protein